MFPTTVERYELTLRMLFEHGRRMHRDSSVITHDPGARVSRTFGEVADRVDRLAAALVSLGVQQGDRVATFCSNHLAHHEAYLAVPMVGAVLHTLNIRLDVSQLAYIVTHAGDKVVIVDEELLPIIEAVLRASSSVEAVVVVGSSVTSYPGAHGYEDLLASHRPLAEYPDLVEHQAALMTYTSGTTGDPKGVVYDHRSLVLHTWGAGLAADAFGIGEQDVCLPVVPYFHANGWGIPHAAWTAGADLVLPGADLSAANIARLIATEHVTFAAAVPTIWSDVLRLQQPVDLSSLRMIACGGAATPRALLEDFQRIHGVPIIQCWGMTETGPLAAVSRRPKGEPATSEFDWRERTGRVIPGVEIRLTDDTGHVLPWDGDAEGEVEVRGPWVTSSYWGIDAADRFDDGWLRTGDVGVINDRGTLRITDRAKDVIKSGGEWISSIALEAELLQHPDVSEVAVIGIPDERWTERPLPCVVLRPGVRPDPVALREHLLERAIRWSVPERWAFIDALPRTSVGKYDKKRLRGDHAAGLLQVVQVDGVTSEPGLDSEGQATSDSPRDRPHLGPDLR